MGYESTLIIGLVNDDSDWVQDRGHRWVHEIATYDLSKMGASSAFHALVTAAKREQEKRYFVFTGPLGDSEAVGNEKVFTDAYDDPLVEIPLPELIEVLSADADHPDPYRRLPPIIAMLREFLTYERAFTHEPYERLIVLHYGH